MIYFSEGGYLSKLVFCSNLMTWEIQRDIICTNTQDVCQSLTVTCIVGSTFTAALKEKTRVCFRLVAGFEEHDVFLKLVTRSTFKTSES